ncbi:unnamed protein product, partial [Rotaria socialis]
MDDIWDEDAKATPHSTSSSAVRTIVSVTPVDETRAVLLMNPGDLTRFDQNNDQLVFKMTADLKGTLDYCQDIVKDAYQAASYVPNLDNPDYAQFWKVQTPLL